MDKKTTLFDVTPNEFRDGIEYGHTQAYRYKDVEVVREYDGTVRGWPGVHKNVYSWWVLANGYAVGWNESPSRGWSFPVIRYSEGVHESSIDFPRQGLDSAIWQKTEDGYVLRPDIKQHILAVLNRYPAENLRRIAAKIQIVGSINTNQYADDADIDVHIQPRDTTAYGEEDPMQIKRWFDQNRDAINGWIGRHPIEVYLQLDPAQDLMSDGVYDLLADEWVVGPKEQEQDYDPYEDFTDIADHIRNEVQNADMLFGELKRDVIDHEVIQQAIERMPANQRQQLVAKLEAKLQEIEIGIEELFKERGEWSTARRTASKPATPEQAREDVELARKWKDENATFKFINRYQYMQVIGDLKKLVGDDDKLDSEDVPKIKTITGVR